ncbi:interleukin-21 receptor [Epinephelus fuscoguttatus]|uniref:interleukin-21 receptor n=1 Tax=Epinephelus fuscoguttatus TaxID=293821 RepID=UPI0020D02B84|nr:interleukin-21 receptor [Epinephelus fuscoguttatus]
MSGPSDMMDWRSQTRLKLMLLNVFLLVSTYTVCLHGNPTTGVDHDLHCVNDYLFTINCTLSIAPSEDPSDSNSSYWLTFTEAFDKTTLVCMLTKTDEYYFCSVQKPNTRPDNDPYPDIFDDLDAFEISLCHNQTETEICEQLEEEYEPVKNIKPNPPCCLTVSHNSSHRHFTWRSTYEKYHRSTHLPKNLKYQLHYYKRGDKHNVLTSHDINTNSVNFTVDDQNFVPDTKYAARVRSSPNGAHFKGQWSDWSSEVYWKTESAMHEVYLKTEAVKNSPSSTFVSGLVKVFIPLCVVVPLVLVLCYTPVKKWKQSAFIPTPAPYFNTLYSDCNGDFKSWVVTQENTADMLKAEETLQIDTFTKCAVVEEEEECQPQFHHMFTEGSAYSNLTDPGCDMSLLGVPYAVSTMAPLSSPGSSFQSLTCSLHPGSPAEGDSGCWLERDPPWYCNEYCTLSAFQQSGPVTAEHHGSPPTKSCTTGTITVEGTTEA